MSFLFSFFKKDDITENKPEVKPTVEETHETKKEKELRDVRSETIQKKSTEQLQQEYDVKKIIKIQAVYRGRDERKRIAQLKKRILHRKNIANEILNTERTYVENLSALCEVIIQPVLKSNLISHDMAHSIFSNLDYKIIKIHVILLQALEKRMQYLKQQNYRLTLVKIGMLFNHLVTFFADEFKSYHHYITNYNDSLDMLTRERQTNPFLDNFLKEARNDARCKNLGASDFLIMPIQRLPRYELLLSDLLRNTEQDTVDYKNIKEALTQVKAIVNYINDLKRQRDSAIRMKVVEAKVIGTTKPSSLVKDGRVLLREGQLTQINILS